MTQDPVWTTVDTYIDEHLVRAEPAIADALDASAAAGLPTIAVTPAQGKLLSLLVRAMRAERVLEIGTLGGYSTIWLASGLPPGGSVLTLELEPKHAAVAQKNLEHANVADRVEIRVGPAADILRQLATDEVAPFDFVFIDADKTGYPDYLRLALPLVQKGSMIVADNVVREGAVADATSIDENVRAVRAFHDLIAKDQHLDATTIQTVGAKGYDGFTIILVR
ncbi:MAG TPA: O-methyltransferase [Gemmatimonadales bacterium]|nr:O-methyltransferase [Gemmatimonadales bacterium]